MTTATAAQIRYIEKLIADWELDAQQVQMVVEHIGGASLSTLTKADASQMIDTLKGPISHIIRPEDYIGKNIYGEEIKEQETVDPATICFCDWDAEECTCGAITVENEEDKEEYQEPIIKSDDADADLPAVYRDVTYADFSFSWLQKLVQDGHTDPLPANDVALIIATGGKGAEVKEWCEKYSAPRLAWMLRQIYNVAPRP
nr:MAG TPA: Protein of unknown function (DUF3072) [Caudoviricetes sp.]